MFPVCAAFTFLTAKPRSMSGLMPQTLAKQETIAPRPRLPSSGLPKHGPSSIFHTRLVIFLSGEMLPDSKVREKMYPRTGEGGGRHDKEFEKYDSIQKQPRVSYAPEKIQASQP